MKRLNIIILLLLTNFHLFSQTNPVEDITEWPADLFENGAVSYIMFYNKENAAEKERIKKEVLDSLTSYGIEVVYTFVPTSTATMVEEYNTMVSKYKPKYVFSFSTSKVGVTGGLFSVPPDATSVMKRKVYPIQRSYTEVLADMRVDADQLMARKLGLSDTLTTAAAIDYSKMPKYPEKADFVKGLPSDLSSSTLAVIIVPNNYYGVTPAMRERVAAENEKIKEIMKEYPYPYEVILYNDYLKTLEKYKYVLLYDMKMEYIKYQKLEMGTPAGSPRRYKEVTQERPVYSLYIIPSTGSTVVYQEKEDWKADYFVTRPYKKFLKYIQDKK